MTTAQITGGTVEFTRPSNYSTDKSGAKVTLTFMCAEGTPAADAEAMLDRTIALAVGRACAMVGERPAIPLTKVITAVLADPLAPTKAVEAAWAGPTVGQPVGGAVDIMGNGVAENPTSANPAPSSGTTPAAMMNGAGSSAGSTTSMMTSPSEPITDKKLVDYVTDTTTRLLTAAVQGPARELAATRVPGLIREFVGPGNKIYAITPERRQDFLDRLAALV